LQKAWILCKFEGFLFIPTIKEIEGFMQARPFFLASIAALIFLPACSPLTLEPVNFGWPVESVVTVNSMNRAEEGRYALSFPVGPLAFAEFKDSTILLGASLRVIRNTEGFYFVTGPRFKNVYVFSSDAGTLKLSQAIEVSQTGLNAPALNQRPPYIELLDGNAPARYLTRAALSEGRPQ
jgi:hypothetical protein